MPHTHSQELVRVEGLVPDVLREMFVRSELEYLKEATSAARQIVTARVDAEDQLKSAGHEMVASSVNSEVISELQKTTRDNGVNESFVDTARWQTEASPVPSKGIARTLHPDIIGADEKTTEDYKQFTSADKTGDKARAQSILASYINSNALASTVDGSTSVQALELSRYQIYVALANVGNDFTSHSDVQEWLEIEKTRLPMALRLSQLGGLFGVVLKNVGGMDESGMDSMPPMCLDSAQSLNSRLGKLQKALQKQRHFTASDEDMVSFDQNLSRVLETYGAVLSEQQSQNYWTVSRAWTFSDICEKLLGLCEKLAPSVEKDLIHFDERKIAVSALALAIRRRRASGM